MACRDVSGKAFRTHPPARSTGRSSGQTRDANSLLLGRLPHRFFHSPIGAIKKRAKIVQKNEKFSQNILVALREVAEEKEHSKSQEDIYAEESIYTKFTSNKDTALFPAWHAASWKDKLKLLDKFEDDRLVGFGKKIIYQEAPETLPPDILKSMKRDIAKRILSERKEKWWTIPTLYTEIDTLREKYTNENDEEKLNLLDEFNNYAMSIQKKYENV